MYVCLTQKYFARKKNIVIFEQKKTKCFEKNILGSLIFTFFCQKPSIFIYFKIKINKLLEKIDILN